MRNWNKNHGEKMLLTDRLVLKAIKALKESSNSAITRHAIAGFSGVGLRTVSDCIARLAGQGYIAVSRENGKPYVFEVLRASGNGDNP